jgi:hypothetical protein
MRSRGRSIRPWTNDSRVLRIVLLVVVALAALYLIDAIQG